MTVDHNNIHRAVVRQATNGDVKHINSLCLQLGYPTSEEHVHRFLEKIPHHEDHALFVAELPDGEVVGWVHVYLLSLVIVELYAEIGGIIVDGRYRQCGIGRLLMSQAERWARERNCRLVRARSRIEREYAHAFYKETGFKLIKTSLTFTKDLSDKNR